MLSTKFPFTLSQSHFKRRGEKNIPGESFLPVSAKKIKQGDQMLPCESMLENSDWARLKIEVIKVTDTDNFFRQGDV